MTSISSNQKAQKLFAGEKTLLVLGILGLVLSAVCAVIVAIQGGRFGPEGDLSKTVSFNAAIGLFYISLAAFLPLSGMKERGRKVFRRTAAISGVLSYLIETIQPLRGYNPRFTRAGEPVDQLIGAFFGLISLVLIVMAIWLFVQFFKRSTLTQGRSLLVLSVRYGMILTMMSVVGGLMMIAVQSRYMGAQGNLIWLHGIGFHGLQTVPFIAFFLERSQLRESAAKRWVHLGGVLWILVELCAYAQTLLDRPMLEFSIIPILAVLFTLAYGAVAAFAFLKSRQQAGHTGFKGRPAA